MKDEDGTRRSIVHASARQPVRRADGLSLARQCLETEVVAAVHCGTVIDLDLFDRYAVLFHCANASG